MATLEELEQLKLAEQGNQEIRDTQRVQDYFNAYKSQGSFLMEKGQITEEQYFGRVRDMGVKLELIGAEEYPDEINEYVKPVMSNRRNHRRNSRSRTCSSYRWNEFINRLIYWCCCWCGCF